MSIELTRRQFLVTATRTTAAIGALGVPLLRAGPATAAPLVRRDVGALTGADPILAGYAKAIAAMKALPATNPLSWSYQAAIHGTTTFGALTAWNTCEHGTYHFWSWHRMYLYYFERIIRQMSGDPGWALPYWNYESATERQLPVPFRDPASALYTPNRGAGWNSGASSLSSFDVDTSSGFALTNFVSASSSIEGTPHGAVHVRVGGWMGSVPTAAQDPIFYLHHANIDRLWNLWLAQGGGRADPLGDVPWKTTKFTFFDETGTQVQLTGCDVLRAAQQLGNTYEGEPPQVNSYCLKFIPIWRYLIRYVIRWPIPPILLSKPSFVTSIDITKLRQQLGTLAKSQTDTLFLKLENVTTPRQPGVVWQVFLGLPKGAKPNAQSPFFVGNLAMFGMGVKSDSGRKFMPASFSFPADNALQNALKSRDNNLTLTFVATGPLVNGKPSPGKIASPVRIGNVSITVESKRKAG